MEVFNSNGFKAAIFKVGNDEVHATIIPERSLDNFPIDQFNNADNLIGKLNSTAFKLVVCKSMKHTRKIVRNSTDSKRHVLIQISKIFIS